MATKPQTSQEYFRTNQTLFFALLAGQILFAVVIASMSFDDGFSPTKGAILLGIFKLLVPIWTFGTILIGKLLFEKQTKALQLSNSLPEKLKGFRTAWLIRAALCESGTLFSLVCTLITGNVLFIIVAIGQILYFITLNPTKDLTVTSLELSVPECAVLDNPDATVL